MGLRSLELPKAAIFFMVYADVRPSIITKPLPEFHRQSRFLPRSAQCRLPRGAIRNPGNTVDATERGYPGARHNSREGMVGHVPDEYPAVVAHRARNSRDYHE